MGYMKKGQAKNNELLGYSGYSGFSLVELMIVVAIIGVLTSIAIPNFQAFQARSRQSEAKSGLSSVYTAMQAFHSNWEVYTGSLDAIGWTPDDDFRYVIGFFKDFHEACGEGGDDLVDGSKLNCGPAPGRIYNGEDGDHTHTGDETTAGLGMLIGKTNLDSATHWADGGSAGALAAGKVTTTVTVNTFFAGAIGDPAGIDGFTTTATTSSLDAWSITENKNLENIQGDKLQDFL